MLGRDSVELFELRNLQIHALRFPTVNFSLVSRIVALDFLNMLGNHFLN